MENNNKTNTKTLTLRLDVLYSERLDVIRKELDHKVNTDAIKNLIDIYPRYKQGIETNRRHTDEIRQLNNKIAELQKEKQELAEAKDNEIAEIKKKVSNFIDTLESLKILNN